MSPDERDNFLENSARDRLRQLLDIAACEARPWTDFYSAPQSSETWYEAYA